MSEVHSQDDRGIDSAFNENEIEVDFEDDHFHARQDIEEDYKLLIEQSKAKHNYWLSDFALKRIKMNQNYILLIVGQVGCQPKGSKVLMADGSWKNIENIVVGDEVISPQYKGSNITSKVIQIHKDYSYQYYDVISETNHEILYSCSNNHKIPHITIQDKEIRVITAEKLTGKKIITFDSDMNEIPVRITPRKSDCVVYGFHLDSPNRWYITDNDMVTHNSGKSYSGISLAEDIDPYFNVDRIIFHPKDFISLLESSLPKGSVIMWEEVGVSLSSRDWYKEQNKIMSSLFETFRRHNLILIMTVPFVKFIDSRIRSMIHGFAEMIDPTFSGGNFGWLKYFHVIVEQRSGKIRHRYPRIRDDEGRIQILQGSSSESGNMKFFLPSEEILPIYEKKKFDFVLWQQRSGLASFEPKKVAEKLEISDFIKIMTSNPRKYKLIQSGKKKTNFTVLQDHNWVLFKLDHPDKNFQKKDMLSALRFVLSSYDYTFKGANKSIQDDEIGTVYQLMDIVGDNKNQIAKMLNTSNHTLTKKISEWERNGMWQEFLDEMELKKQLKEEQDQYAQYPSSDKDSKDTEDTEDSEEGD